MEAFCYAILIEKYPSSLLCGLVHSKLSPFQKWEALKAFCQKGLGVRVRKAWHFI